MTTRNLAPFRFPSQVVSPARRARQGYSRPGVRRWITQGRAEDPLRTRSRGAGQDQAPVPASFFVHGGGFWMHPHRRGQAATGREEAIRLWPRATSCIASCCSCQGTVWLSVVVGIESTPCQAPVGMSQPQAFESAGQPPEKPSSWSQRGRTKQPIPIPWVLQYRLVAS